jgi:hypothetical protein
MFKEKYFGAMCDSMQAANICFKERKVDNLLHRWRHKAGQRTRYIPFPSTARFTHLSTVHLSDKGYGKTATAGQRIFRPLSPAGNRAETHKVKQGAKAAEKAAGRQNGCLEPCFPVRFGLAT